MHSPIQPTCNASSVPRSNASLAKVCALPIASSGFLLNYINFSKLTFVKYVFSQTFTSECTYSEESKKKNLVVTV